MNQVHPIGDGLLFPSFFCLELFVLKSLIKDSPKVLDRVNVVTFRGPTFHHVNPMLQPTLGGLCRVTRRLVLLQFPPILFVLNTTLAQPAAASSPKCLGMRVRRECLHTIPIQFSLGSRILPTHPPSAPTAPSPSQELRSQIWPRQQLSWVASFELF